MSKHLSLLLGHLAAAKASLEPYTLEILQNILNNDDYEECTDGRCDGKHEAQTLHTCPFLHDVRDDEETLCDCCEECETECGQEI